MINKTVKLLISSGICIFLFMIIGCSRSHVRIIERKENKATIQGIGRTKVEAKKNAMEKAKSIFENVKETNEADCSQEITSTRGHYVTGARTYSYWSCVIYVEKE